MKYFLAFSYNMHDSSVSIADESQVLLVLEAERFFGEKKKRCDHGEMEVLVAQALSYCRISIDDIEGVVCTSYLNDHLPEAQRNCRWRDTAPIELAGKKFEAVVLNHHLAHAAMVYGFKEAKDVAIDVVDGGGDFGDTHFTYRCRNGKLEALQNAAIHNRFSSRFYDVVSRYLYGQIMCEGKLMALAVLGEPQPTIVQWLSERLEDFHRLPTQTSLNALAKAFPFAEYQTDQRAFNLAASAQSLFEQLRVQSVEALPQDAPQVLLSGGGTLNILANTRVREALGAKRPLLIPPCCDDTGQSLGALLYYCHEDQKLPITARMPFLGFSDSIDDRALGADDVTDELVDRLARGQLVFLHHGQSEIGPRALGHRSILGRPTQRSHDLINHLIKGREFYRPLAPLVPLDRVSEWFEWEGESRFMLFAGKAKPPAWVHAQGVCHYDGTARIQTIARQEQPFLHTLLDRMGEAVDCPILINTSLNPRGVPICSRREETHKFRAEFRNLPIHVFPS